MTAVDQPSSPTEPEALEISLASATELCRLGLGTMVDIRQTFEIEMKGAIPGTVHIPLFEVKQLLGHALTEDEQDILEAGKPSASQMTPAIAAKVKAVAKDEIDRIDWDSVKRIAAERRGIAARITGP
mgnify:CR=1 FL=1